MSEWIDKLCVDAVQLHRVCCLMVDRASQDRTIAIQTRRVNRQVRKIKRLMRRLSLQESQLRQKNRIIAEHCMNSDRQSGIIEGQQQIIRYLRGDE